MPPESHTPLSRYLDPKTVAQLASMTLRARLVVEGFISGLHRSPYRGASVEFAEHRGYSPGDELRHLDWRAWGRSDRLYVKQYEEETNLRAYLLLDTSASMGYASAEVSKLSYASYLAAALAYLMVGQGDSVGLAAFSDSPGTYIPARAHPAHLPVLFHALEALRPEGRTHLHGTLSGFAPRIRRRGLVVLFSDLLDDPATTLTGLRLLRQAKHDLIVFHILDPAEIRFPYADRVKIIDPETGRDLILDGRMVARDYVKRMEEHSLAFQRGCLDAAVDYYRLDSSLPFDRGLLAYLGKREESVKRRRT